MKKITQRGDSTRNRLTIYEQRQKEGQEDTIRKCKIDKKIRGSRTKNRQHFFKDTKDERDKKGKMMQEVSTIRGRGNRTKQPYKKRH